MIQEIENIPLKPNIYCNQQIMLLNYHYDLYSIQLITNWQPSWTQPYNTRNMNVDLKNKTLAIIWHKRIFHQELFVKDLVSSSWNNSSDV